MEKKYRCRGSLHKEIIESTKQWLDKENTKYQDFFFSKNEMRIQIEKNKTFIKMKFKPYFPDEENYYYETLLTITNGKVSWNLDTITEFAVNNKCPSEKEKNYLNKVAINIFKIIDKIIKIEGEK